MNKSFMSELFKVIPILVNTYFNYTMSNSFVLASVKIIYSDAI